MKPGREVIEVNLQEWEGLLERARKEPLDEKGYEKLQAALRAFCLLTDLIGEKDTTISRLRAVLGKPSTEKMSKVLQQAGLEPPAKSHPSPGGKASPSEKAKAGHGRNGAAAYQGAERVKIPHASLKPGDHCPDCLKGKVYVRKGPTLRIRVVGQAPLAATVYELESLRNLCGEIFEATAPESVGEKKYDESAAAMIGLLKYGSGVPFYRLAGLEASLGIPLPPATQWEIMAETAAVIQPAFDEAIRQAAQGEVLYNDDTAMKILALVRASPPAAGGGRGTIELAGAHRAVHFGDCLNLAGAADSAIFHRTEACGGESCPGVGTAGCRAGSAHPNVRRVVPQLPQAAQAPGNHCGEL